MIVLGLNAFHADSAAALVVDNAVVAAAEEERFRRIKHWAGFPSQAIGYCLRAEGLRIGDVDVVAVNTDPKAARWRRAAWALRSLPSPRLVLEKLRHRARRGSALDLLCAQFPDQQVKAVLEHVPHHYAHLASAFYASGFERAVALSVDGFGDFASAAWGLGEGARLTMDGHVWFPHSLGIFYQAMTQYLGFPNYGDEYKVMGLAPYGKPTYVDALRRVLNAGGDGSYRLDLRYFRHHRDQVAYEWESGAPRFEPLYSPALVELLGPARDPASGIEQRHRDLAHSVQSAYEDAFFALLSRLSRGYGDPRLVLAGGCAQNSVANGKIALRSSFREVYVAAAGYDAGGAVGAALAASVRRTQRRPAALDHAFLGPSFDGPTIDRLLDTRGTALAEASCRRLNIADERELCERVAAHIAEGAVVGWFQGRMEWGPRALGARSILGDPRRADMKDILNRKIKRRESFRPFAPSVLREHVAEWFEQDADVPFMGQVFQIRAARRAGVPAVTHVDGSGRLQTVDRAAAPRYHALISAFHRATGVPMVLNTSFNENEPIVCRPEEALDCFLRTQMDVLVMGDHVLERAT